MTEVEPSKPAGLKRAIAALAWALAFAYSWAPFDVGFAPRFGEADAGDPAYPLPLAFHLFVFALVGAADRLGAAEKDEPKRAILWVLARGLAFCLVLEIGQMFVASRHADVADLISNVAGFSVGHFSLPLGFWSVGNHTNTALALPQRRTGFALLAVWALLWWTLLLVPARLVSLGDWDPAYSLLIGNEKGGGRPWDGEIRYAAIYSRALQASHVREARAYPPGTPRSAATRAAMGLAAAYDFTEPDRLEIKPEGGLDDSLRMGVRGKARWSDGNPAALILRNGAVLTSARPAEALSREISSSGAFSVELWLKPSSLSQTGPARIIGISESAWRRNFTLGQEGKALYFRVRNPINGPNGSEYELRCEDALSESFAQVVATYDWGTSSIYRDGRRLRPTMDLREPSVLLGLGPNPAAHAVTALLAALTLVVVGSSFPEGLASPQNTFRFFLIGYALLVIPVLLTLPSHFRTAISLHVWFGPALVISWACLLGGRRVRRK